MDTTTLTRSELAGHVRDATNLVSTRDAANLLERVAALRSGGEPEARILARLNGPADPTPLDEHPTPSRGAAGMTPAQRIERANRVSAETLADHIAAKVIAAIIHREAELDEADDATIPDPQQCPVTGCSDPIGSRCDSRDEHGKPGACRNIDAPPVVTDMQVCKDGHPPHAHPKGIACVACAELSGVVTASPGGKVIDVPANAWERAKEPPAIPKLRLRATGKAVLDLLRPLPLTGLCPGMTVNELCDELGLEYATCTGRVITLYRSGHLERTRIGGAYVYRLAVEWKGDE